MKKLFFLILFFSINILTFGANVYFLNDSPGYIYTNEQTFYSNQDGRALIAYHLWADPAKYYVDQWGARFQDPDGNWSDWSALSSSYGSHECLKAGTWYVQGRVHVDYDIFGYSNYWMYTSFTLYFYVVDINPPAIPQNFQVTQNGNNNPYLTWSGNSEKDFSYYEIWKKGGNEGGDWHIKTTTTTPSFIDIDETVVSGPRQMNEGTAYYKIKSVDVNNNKSEFTNQVEIRVSLDPPYKSNYNLSSNSTLNYNLLQNYPNPFNPLTTIRYVLKESGFVTLKVFDNLGNEISTLVNEVKPEGIFEVEFDASKLPSGIYIYSIRVNDFVQNQKMIFLK